jgi:cellulose synthase/poly-beta-1,6-N-acetylglucosamine synthase-like glycosyltransferase
MNSDQAATVLALTWMVSVFCLYLVEIAGTSLYDLGQLKKQRQRLKHPNSKQYRRRPLISVIVPVNNGAKDIEDTLASIFKGSYRKVEVIVVDNATSGETKSTIKRYINEHPKQAIKLTAKRKKVTTAGVIRTGFSKVRGELVLILKPGERLEKNSLRTAVQHFAEEDVDMLIPQVLSRGEPSIISLLQQFDNLTGAQQKKLNLSTFSEYAGRAPGAIYSKAAFSRLKNFTQVPWTNRVVLSKANSKLARKPLNAYYASDVLVEAQPLESYLELFKQRFRRAAGVIRTLSVTPLLVVVSQPKIFNPAHLILMLWNKVILVLEPFIMVYFIFLALSFHRPLFYLISWLALTCLLGLSVWKNDQLSGRRKLKLLPFLPIIYNLLYIVRFMDIISLLINSVRFSRGTPKLQGRTILHLPRLVVRTKTV